jgi:hypothetical protein
MDTIEYRYLDKSTWEEGPWKWEPDKVQWPDRGTGLPCLAARNRMGAWCGYVGITEAHPWFGLGYSDRIDRLPEDESYGPALRPDGLILVHGGLTFASACDPDATEERGICHKPSAGEPDHVWWFGFDCSHWGDYWPGNGEADAWRSIPRSGIYRDMAYVKFTCAKLAEQLVHFGKQEAQR